MLAIFDWYAISDQGPIPEANEDCVIAEPGYGIFLVADGMGGRPGGAQACSVASRTFTEALRRATPAARLDDNVLRQAAAAANTAVFTIGENEPGMSGMGTTLTALVLGEKHGKVVHIGDSRAYCFDRGELEQLTEDHTLVQELTARSPRAGAEIRRMGIRHVLCRAVGTRPTVEPEIIELVLLPGEWFLLATDGLHTTLSLKTMESLIDANESGGARAICRAIMDAALKAGPTDNLTLLVVQPLGAR